MRILVIGVSLLFTVFGSALATSNTCDGNTMQMESCMAEKLANKERELDRLYSRILKGLAQPDEPSIPYAETKRKFILAQRAWASFREKDCDALYTYASGGTIRGMESLVCRYDHTELRIKQLKNAW